MGGIHRKRVGYPTTVQNPVDGNFPLSHTIAPNYTEFQKQLSFLEEDTGLPSRYANSSHLLYINNNELKIWLPVRHKVRLEVHISFKRA